jgi:hypothetical protein
LTMICVSKVDRFIQCHAAVPGFATMHLVSGLWPWQGPFSCRLWPWSCPFSWPSNISSVTLPGDCLVFSHLGALWPWDENRHAAMCRRLDY